MFLTYEEKETLRNKLTQELARLQAEFLDDSVGIRNEIAILQQVIEKLEAEEKQIVAH